MYERLASWSKQHPRLVVWSIAAAIGFAVFFLWIGYARTLDPTDIKWIFHEDPFTHVMGWEQFRNAPLLQYPITKNALYGLEWSSTCVFTDSIPLVAIVLRPLSAVLPHPCQYLGWWILLCLVLQAYWAMRLVLLRTDRLRDAALGAMFFVTCPVVLERLGLQTAVGTHWLILWALWLYLSAESAAIGSWLVLLLLTVSIHAYVFVMVGAIWAAHLINCRMRGLLPRRELALAGASLFAVLVWMHVLGYFMVGMGAAGGTWRSNFDLIGFFAPSYGAHFGVLPRVYNDPWDGSAYLGAGMILLLIASVVARFVWKQRSPRDIRWAPLVTVIVGLAVFAITNTVTFANKRVFGYPIPHFVTGLYETFRGATRMIWPAYYVVCVGTLWLALRAWPRRVVSFVIGAAVVVQLADLSGIGSIKRAEVKGTGIMRPIQDPVWQVIAAHYRNIVSVPAKHRQYDWPTFAWFAARNALGSNIGYLSRNNPTLRAAGAALHLDAVATGHYDPATVYYFPSPIMWAVGARTMGPQDAAVTADGYHLIIPDGRTHGVVSQPTPYEDVPFLGKWILFREDDPQGLLLDGWSWREQWGTWSIAKHASLALPVPANEKVRVSFKWLPGATHSRTQRIHVRLGTQTFDVDVPHTGVTRDDAFEVTTTGRLLQVDIDLAELVERPNQRPTGLGLVAARVQRASDPVDDEVPAAAHGAPVLDSWISFAGDGPGRALLGDGWSWGEAWGTWSDAEEPLLALPVPANERVSITLRWLATAPKDQTQTAHVLIDDTPFDVRFAASDKAEERTFEVTSKRGWVTIKLAIGQLVAAADGRFLGIGLEAARVQLSGAAPPTR